MPDHIDELKKLQNLRNVSDQTPLEFEDLFELVESGCNGEINVCPRSIAERLNDGNYAGLSTLPNELPPIISSDHDLDLEEYLVHPERLPIHNFHRSQRFWSRKPEPELLYHAKYSPMLMTLKVERDFKTGKLLGYKEVDVLHADQTGKNSTSLQRQPDSYDSEITGNSTNIPFRPGGLESSDKDVVKREETTLDFENDLLSVPPGFLQKISFNSEDECDGKSVINISDILSGNDIELDEDVVDSEETTEDEKVKEINQEKDEISNKLKRNDSLEKLIVENEIQSNEVVSEANDEPDVKTWAVMVNIEDPVKDFHKIVPDMAKQFPFELDTFQKQAVIQLENKECVFVAAHTSAGKTVVAEYSIALASKHMTKAIYTSPIKALSNQKFRDFKDTFESVGLITGDVQINPEASCLVMTTEILRSMLYRGSRVIRDTEWVIFDEIHYVNDVERGVVWEEVLIMLPDHVNIIMLSATVPNTKEFAEWVGRIKKKKMHVISTSKRPVPLEYFLYTGNSKKTSDESFQIVDTLGKFKEIGYKQAVDAKNQRKKKSKEATGPKGPRYNASANEDRNVWISLIHKLEETDPIGLPVVAFTFSRTRCNDNANRLSSLDLTTKKEKNQIKTFIQKCVSKLKDEDAMLPQVKQMEELLNRGLAVHHSGILPILKEMIEMLFQEGLVKLLFATETFAMGVNMPAKTVVFDSVRKHDGNKFRDLLPGEFIQMAGRAGRRGKDKSGTVIILCKGDVPELSDLKKMMMGKPTLLESRFRVTFSMILNLHRSSEDLSVEEMMKRSFAEFHLLKNAPERERLIKETEIELKNLDILSCQKCQCDIADYYKDCKSIRNLRKLIQAAVISSTNGQKALSPGRIIILKNEELKNIYGVILNKKQPYSTTDTDVTRSKKSYDVFVLCDTRSGDAKPDHNETLTPFVREMTIFCPDRPCQHKIMNVIENEITLITDRVINVNSEAIVGDYKKRQLPRFRDNPPGKSTMLAMEELLRISESNPRGLPQESLPLKDMEIQESITQLSLLESRMEYYKCVGCLCFEEHFKKYRDERILRDRIKNLQEKSSLEMLSLNPQYKTRKQVLYELGYLENERSMVHDKPHDNLENVVVSMKGLVACEISSHEIVISWLLLNKFFDNYEPEEIVALLSCFVFQQKRCSEPTLTEKLEKGKQIIEDTGKQLYRMEQKNKTCSTVEEYEEFQEYKFGLVQAVYEWAKGMPFYEITQLTDVQEGIIVRCIQRLNELCQDVKNAAKKLGVVELQTKMESASNLLKRDIVFAASLYIQ